MSVNDKEYYFIVEKTTTMKICAKASYEDIARRRVLNKLESGKLKVKDDKSTKFRIKRAR